MANYTSTHTGATIDASVTIISGSGVTQSDLIKLNAVTSSAIELNILDGVTASTAEINILDGLTATTAELNYLDGADSSITTLSLPDNTTITTFGASLVDDADAASARTTLGVDVAGTDNSTDVTLVTTSHDYLSISGQAITLGSIDISDDTNLVGGTGITLTGDTLSTTDSEIVHDNLSGFVSNEHIDHSTVSISAGTGLSGGGDLTSTRTLSTNDSEIVHDNLSGFVANEHIDHSTVSITAGTGLSGGGDITTSRTLTTDDSAIVHDNLSGFVANEHIDHSGVSITAGAGLTGGGDITATRDIAVGAGTGVTVNADDIAIGQDVATNADVTFNSVTADIIGDIRGATKFQAKADVALNKGDAVYISGVSGTTPTVDIADANDSAKMPSFGLAASSVSINASVEIITFGTLAGLNTSGFSVGDILYISTNGTSGNTLTATPPTGESSLIQNIGKVQRSHASAGSIKVGGAGRSNATPNLNDGNIFIGNGSNQAVSASLNTKIEDYLDGGTSTANFDTISVDGAEITATPAELNVLDGITSTTAELNYTDGVTSNIQTQLDAKAPLASPAFTGTATGANLTLSGDLTVNGSTTTLDTTNLAVEDNLMELNAGVTSNANDSGFLIERGTTGDNAIFMWDESADKFTLGTTTATGTTTGDITLSSTGTLVANVEGNVTGAVTGNADTATTLATARNFSLTGDVTAGAVSFDGSGNVALSTTIAANSVALGTDTTGNYMSDLTEGTGIDISHTPGEGSNGTITLDLTEVGFGGGANRLITDDGDGTVSTEANLTFDGSTLALTGDLNVGSGDFFVDDSAGNVGIGTQSPSSYRLQFGNGGDKIGVDLSSGGTTRIAEIEFYNGVDGSLRLKTDNASTGGIQFHTQGSQRMEVLSGGNIHINNSLGIGTDSPNTKMHIKDASNNVDLRIETDKVNGNAQVQYLNDARQYNAGINNVDAWSVYDATAAETRFTINSSGNVGIGTSSPSYLLHLSGTAPELAFTDTDGSATWRARAVTNNFHITETGAGDPFVIQSGAGANALVINSSGNVGIGTNSPASKLHIQEATAGTPASTFQSALKGGLILEDDSTTTANNILIKSHSLGNDEAIGGIKFVSSPDSGNYSWAGIQGLVSTFAAAGQLAFYTAANNTAGATSTERMRIDESGNVGIGTNSPGSYNSAGDNLVIAETSGGAGITLASATNGSGHILFADSTSGTGAYDGFIRYDHTTSSMRFAAAGGVERMRIDSSGNVGIGVTGGTYKLEVGASQKIGYYGSSSNYGYFEPYNGADGHMRFVNNWGSGDAHILLLPDGNVGIGTNSPESKLNIVDSGETIIRLYASTASTRSGIWFTNGSYSYGTNIGTDNKFHITGNINSEAELVTVDSLGNVGIGVIPKTGGSTWQHIQFGGTGNLIARKSDTTIDSMFANNYYVNSSNVDSYITTGAAARMFLNDNEFNFDQAASGSTDAAVSFTTAMKIDSSGNVGIGTTSPDSKLQVEYTTTSNGSAAIAEFGTSGSGSIANSGHQVIIGGPSVNGYTGLIIHSDSTSGNGQISFADGRGANDSWRGSIVYEHANDRMEFWTNAGEKIAINSDGDFIPAGDGTQDLGSLSKRWGVVHSADLDLSNEGSQNDVDGTWGSYVIQEGEEDLFIINRRNGKKYKFMLQEVQD